MFVSYQKNYAVPLVIYEHVYEVSSLYDIGSWVSRTPVFQQIPVRYIYRSIDIGRRFRMQIEGRVFSQTIQDTDFPDPTS